MAKFKKINGSITAPLGFRAAALFCNVKTLGTGKGSDKGQKHDLALIVSDVPAKAAGMFTTNQICAAPVKLCVEHLRNNTACAVVINSGNANACTGPQGLADALEMAALTGQALGLKTTDVLVGSTGRIGVPLPMPNIRKGITAVAGNVPLDLAVQNALYVCELSEREVPVHAGADRPLERRLETAQHILGDALCVRVADAFHFAQADGVDLFGR